MSKIKNNILYNFAYQILILIIPLVTAPYVSRVIGVDGIGIYSYVSSVVYYFFILVTLGLNNYGNRSIAKNREKRKTRSQVFWSIYFMQLIIGIGVVCIYVIYCNTLVEGLYRTYFYIYIFYIVGAVIDINWFFFGIEEFKFTTIRNSIIKILTLILIFTFVRGERALFFYFIIVAVSTLLSNLILWTKLFNKVDFYKPSLKEIIQHIKPNLLLFIPILAMSVYRVLDKIMIKELSGIIENGYYENADRIISISMTLFSAVSIVMLPTISSMIVNGNKNKVIKMLRDVMQVVMCLSIGMTFGLIAIANKFAPLFFGEEFIETGYLLIGLSITIVFSGWKNVLRSQYLIPYEKDRAYVISLIVGALINIIVNIVCIPKFGARGAVFGTIVAEVTGLIIQTYVVAKEINIFMIVKDAVIFIPAALIMGISVKVLMIILPYNLLSVGIAIVLGAIEYIFLIAVSIYVFEKNRFYYMLSLAFKQRRKKLE